MSHLGIYKEEDNLLEIASQLRGRRESDVTIESVKKARIIFAIL